MHFKPFQAILDHVFFQPFLIFFIFGKIFHIFGLRGGGDPMWNFPHFFFFFLTGSLMGHPVFECFLLTDIIKTKYYI